MAPIYNIYTINFEMQWQLLKQNDLRQTLIGIHGHMSMFRHKLDDMVGKHHNGTCVAGETWM